MRDASALAKAQRLSRISYLLYRHPRGLTAAELARLCQVSTRTIQRDLHDLEATGVPLWDDEAAPPRYGIVEGYYLPPVHLGLDDALTLYRALRLLARHENGHDPTVAHALAKVATILPEPLAGQVQATVQRLSAQDDAAGTDALGVLALGWASGRVVRLTYVGAGDPRPQERLVHPYLIEPSPIAGGTYLIAHDEGAGALRTFKLERIRRAALTERTFAPAEGLGPELLDSAWGIMYGEDLQEVVLRFAPSATARLRETVWHPTQRLEGREDGGCLLRLQVAHPEEMVYWIRGWGPQVEVLAPGWLRARMAEEARKTTEVYGVDR